MRRLPLLAALALAAAGAPHLASAQPAAGSCRPHQTDAAERPAPDALLARLGQAFGVPPDSLHGGSYVRCDDGRLMGCMVGANLNCGRSDVSRRSPGGNAFCRANPGADVVPMAATGHDTIYDWHCVGAKAVAGKIVAPVDHLGFMRGNWRPLR